jgi:hypothetical protein
MNRRDEDRTSTECVVAIVLLLPTHIGLLKEARTFMYIYVYINTHIYIYLRTGLSRVTPISPQGCYFLISESSLRCPLPIPKDRRVVHFDS